MDIPTLAEQLEAATRSGEYDGYGPRPIPHPLDEPVEILLRAIRRDGPTGGEIISCLDEEVGWVLLAYAERAAALAVRLGSLLVLELAIVGLGLAQPGDYRDKLVVMPLPWRSTELLGESPHAIYAQIAAELPEPGRRDLLSFAQRSPPDQTLSVMGYREGADQDGFRYVRLW
jgi:hypothetical protein